MAAGEGRAFRLDCFARPGSARHRKNVRRKFDFTAGLVGQRTLVKGLQPHFYLARLPLAPIYDVFRAGVDTM